MRQPGGLAGSQRVEKFGHVQETGVGFGFMHLPVLALATRDDFPAIVGDEKSFFLAVKKDAV